MKARIKETGEIIKIADYATIALDDHDSWGNPIEVKPEEVELIYDTTETTEDKHWQDVKERAAIAAMQGILSNAGLVDGQYEYRITVEKAALGYADELVKLLKGE